MDRQSNGRFVSSPSISDEQHQYKFRIRRDNEEWIYPYVTAFYPERNTDIC